eukprot:GHVU01047228.1.p2 GENE.GHVU01047228.1~~GHVU01047228.1.p2  ORF type:complete len:107 (+),score=7.02 GHVU01047228.1:103-423(+)
MIIMRHRHRTAALSCSTVVHPDGLASSGKIISMQHEHAALACGVASIQHHQHGASAAYSITSMQHHEHLPPPSYTTVSVHRRRGGEVDSLSLGRMSGRGARGCDGG